MYGVVLWSDTTENKAVFWCEDHGDLAFFQAEPGAAGSAFDAGDMVEFDVYIDCKLRKARNPIILQERVYSDLPEKLLRSISATASEGGEVDTAQPAGDNVLPFRSRATAFARAYA